MIKKLQQNLIVADNLYMASAAPLLAVRDAQCPIVAQVADRWLLFNLVDWSAAVRPQIRFQRWVAGAIRHGIQRPLTRKVRLDGIATVSNFIRNLYLDAGFAPEILETTYLGIHNEVFYPGPEHPLSDPVRLMFAGALWEGKGPQVAVQALRILSQQDGLPRFHLDIFGDGAEGFKQYLRRVIADAGVEHQVTIHGFVPWARLVQAMHQSDIFLFPSIWDEPFAITPLQALGCGLPVVATRTGGTPEGLTDGETALLVPPNDPQAMAEAIVRLVQDETLRRRLREYGIRKARERWGFDAYVNRLLDFYQRVTERWKQSRQTEQA